MKTTGKKTSIKVIGEPDAHPMVREAKTGSQELIQLSLKKDHELALLQARLDELNESGNRESSEDDLSATVEPQELTTIPTEILIDPEQSDKLRKLLLSIIERVNTAPPRRMPTYLRNIRMMSSLFHDQFQDHHVEADQHDMLLEVLSSVRLFEFILNLRACTSLFARLYYYSKLRPIKLEVKRTERVLMYAIRHMVQLAGRPFKFSLHRSAPVRSKYIVSAINNVLVSMVGMGGSELVAHGGGYQDFKKTRKCFMDRLKLEEGLTEGEALRLNRRVMEHIFSTFHELRIFPPDVLLNLYSLHAKVLKIKKKSLKLISAVSNEGGRVSLARDSSSERATKSSRYFNISSPYSGKGLAAALYEKTMNEVLRDRESKLIPGPKYGTVFASSFHRGKSSAKSSRFKYTSRDGRDRPVVSTSELTESADSRNQSPSVQLM